MNRIGDIENASAWALVFVFKVRSLKYLMINCFTHLPSVVFQLLEICVGPTFSDGGR